MAFPVPTVIRSAGFVDVPAVTVNVPALAAGELVILWFSHYTNTGASPLPATPAGYTLGAFTPSSKRVNAAYFSKTAATSEGATTVSLSRNDGLNIAGVAHAIVIPANGGFEASAILFDEVTSTTTLAAPSITPTWGLDDTLFLSLGATGRTNQIFSGVPASYTFDQGLSGVSAGGNGVASAVGYRALATATASPGNFSYASFTDAALLTIAVKPAGPTVTTTDTLQPGAAFSLTYSNFSGIPASPVAISDGTTSINVPVTVSDNGSGGGTAPGTFPALTAQITAGAGGAVKWGSVTVELTV
jgi:hypothetical protein